MLDSREGSYSQVTTSVEPTSVPKVCPSLSGVPTSEVGTSLLVTDKGKEVSIPFGPGLSSPVGHSIVDQYIVPALVATVEPPVFCPDWGVHINNRAFHLDMALEILEKLPFLRMLVSPPNAIFVTYKRSFEFSNAGTCHLHYNITYLFYYAN